MMSQCVVLPHLRNLHYLHPKILKSLNAIIFLWIQPQIYMTFKSFHLSRFELTFKYMSSVNALELQMRLVIEAIAEVSISFVRFFFQIYSYYSP